MVLTSVSFKMYHLVHFEIGAAVCQPETDQKGVRVATGRGPT
jgi:hypothetical protein